jgi:hypothetical protein
LLCRRRRRFRRSPSPGRRRFLLARCRFPRFPPLLSSFPSSSCNFPPLPLSFPLSWLSSFPPSLSFPPFPPPPLVVPPSYRSPLLVWPPSSFGPPPLVIALIALHLRLSFALAVLVVRSRGLYRSSLSSLAFALAVLVVHLVVLFVLVVRPRRPCRSPRRPCRSPRRPCRSPRRPCRWLSSSLLFALVVLAVRPCRPRRSLLSSSPFVLVIHLVVFVLRPCRPSSVERCCAAHIPLERGGAAAAVVRSTRPGALVCRGGGWW